MNDVLWFLRGLIRGLVSAATGAFSGLLLGFLSWIFNYPHLEVAEGSDGQLDSLAKEGDILAFLVLLVIYAFGGTLIGTLASTTGRDPWARLKVLAASAAGAVVVTVLLGLTLLVLTIGSPGSSKPESIDFLFWLTFLAQLLGARMGWVKGLEMFDPRALGLPEPKKSEDEDFAA